MFEVGAVYRMSDWEFWEFLGIDGDGDFQFQRLSDTWTVTVTNPVLDDKGELSWEQSMGGHWVSTTPLTHRIPLNKPVMYSAKGSIVCYRCIGCPYEDKYQRNPQAIGGLGLCERLIVR